MLLQGNCGFKMRQLPFMGVICTVMLFIVYRTTDYQYHKTEVYANSCFSLHFNGFSLWLRRQNGFVLPGIVMFKGSFFFFLTFLAHSFHIGNGFLRNKPV